MIENKAAAKGKGVRVMGPFYTIRGRASNSLLWVSIVSSGKTNWNVPGEVDKIKGSFKEMERYFGEKWEIEIIWAQKEEAGAPSEQVYRSTFSEPKN